MNTRRLVMAGLAAGALVLASACTSESDEPSETGATDSETASAQPSPSAEEPSGAGDATAPEADGAHDAAGEGWRMVETRFASFSVPEEFPEALDQGEATQISAETDEGELSIVSTGGEGLMGDPAMAEADLGQFADFLASSLAQSLGGDAEISVAEREAYTLEGADEAYLIPLAGSVGGDEGEGAFIVYRIGDQVAVFGLLGTPAAYQMYGSQIIESVTAS